MSAFVAPNEITEAGQNEIGERADLSVVLGSYIPAASLLPTFDTLYGDTWLDYGCGLTLAEVNSC